MGDSAGGSHVHPPVAILQGYVANVSHLAGCCLLSNLELKRLGIPQPAAGILVSPWIDMALRSFDGGNALVETDYVVTANHGVPLFAKRWIGEIDGTSPEVNPLYCKPSDFDGIPPQLILVGGGDFVLPECRELCRLFREANLQHEMVVEWGEFHLYALGSRWIHPTTRAKTDAIFFRWLTEALKITGI